MITIDYQGIGEISTAIIPKQTLLDVLAGLNNSFLLNPEVWQTISISYTVKNSTQKINLVFKIDDHTLEEFEYNFIVEEEVIDEDFIFNRLTLQDKGNGVSIFTDQDLGANLSFFAPDILLLENAGFILTESNKILRQN